MMEEVSLINHDDSYWPGPTEYEDGPVYLVGGKHPIEVGPIL